jgi:hypothetical protein
MAPPKSRSETEAKVTKGEETASYLRPHLALAGRSDTLFSDDAARLIHQTSRGYPRTVNNLAIQALVAPFATDQTIQMLAHTDFLDAAIIDVDATLTEAAAPFPATPKRVRGHPRYFPPDRDHAARRVWSRHERVRIAAHLASRGRYLPR